MMTKVKPVRLTSQSVEESLAIRLADYYGMDETSDSVAAELSLEDFVKRAHFDKKYFDKIKDQLADRDKRQALYNKLKEEYDNALANLKIEKLNGKERFKQLLEIEKPLSFLASLTLYWAASSKHPTEDKTISAEENFNRNAQQKILVQLADYKIAVEKAAGQRFFVINAQRSKQFSTLLKSAIAESPHQTFQHLLTIRNEIRKERFNFKPSRLLRGLNETVEGFAKGSAYEMEYDLLKALSDYEYKSSGRFLGWLVNRVDPARVEQLSRIRKLIDECLNREINRQELRQKISGVAAEIKQDSSELKAILISYKTNIKPDQDHATKFINAIESKDSSEFIIDNDRNPENLFGDQYSNVLAACSIVTKDNYQEYENVSAYQALIGFIKKKEHRTKAEKNLLLVNPTYKIENFFTKSFSYEDKESFLEKLNTLIADISKNEVIPVELIDITVQHALEYFKNKVFTPTNIRSNKNFRIFANSVFLQPLWNTKGELKDQLNQYYCKTLFEQLQKEDLELNKRHQLLIEFFEFRNIAEFIFNNTEAMSTVITLYFKNMFTEVIHSEHTSTELVNSKIKQLIQALNVANTYALIPQIQKVLIDLLRTELSTNNSKDKNRLVEKIIRSDWYSEMVEASFHDNLVVGLKVDTILPALIANENIPTESIKTQTIKSINSLARLSSKKNIDILLDEIDSAITISQAITLHPSLKRDDVDKEKMWNKHVLHTVDSKTTLQFLLVNDRPIKDIEKSFLFLSPFRVIILRKLRNSINENYNYALRTKKNDEVIFTRNQLISLLKAEANLKAFIYEESPAELDGNQINLLINKFKKIILDIEQYKQIDDKQFDYNAVISTLLAPKLISVLALLSKLLLKLSKDEGNDSSWKLTLEKADTLFNILLPFYELILAKELNSKIKDRFARVKDFFTMRKKEIEILKKKDEEARKEKLENDNIQRILDANVLKIKDTSIDYIFLHAKPREIQLFLEKVIFDKNFEIKFDPLLQEKLQSFYRENADAANNLYNQLFSILVGSHHSSKEIVLRFFKLTDMFHIKDFEFSNTIYEQKIALRSIKQTLINDKQKKLASALSTKFQITKPTRRVVNLDNLEESIENSSPTSPTSPGVTSPDQGGEPSADNPTKCIYFTNLFMQKDLPSTLADISNLDFDELKDAINTKSNAVIIPLEDFLKKVTPQLKSVPLATIELLDKLLKAKIINEDGEINGITEVTTSHPSKMTSLFAKTPALKNLAQLKQSKIKSYIDEGLKELSAFIKQCKPEENYQGDCFNFILEFTIKYPDIAYWASNNIDYQNTLLTTKTFIYFQLCKELLSHKKDTKDVSTDAEFISITKELPIDTTVLNYIAALTQLYAHSVEERDKTSSYSSDSEVTTDSSHDDVCNSDQSVDVHIQELFALIKLMLEGKLELTSLATICNYLEDKIIIDEEKKKIISDLSERLPHQQPTSFYSNILTLGWWSKKTAAQQPRTTAPAYTPQ